MNNINKSIEKYAERQMRRRIRRRSHEVVPADIPERLQRLGNVKAVLWDIYGTLLLHPCGSPLPREEMIRAFKLTAKEFGFERFLDGDPSGILLSMYQREIEKVHERKRSRGTFSPEIKIEKIWLKILRRLERSGYRPAADGEVNLDLAFKVAFFFDDIQEAKGLYPGVIETLEGIKNRGMRQGIISNAQFYTPITLNVLFRQSGIKEADPLRHFFDRQLMLFSYRVGVSKPNLLPYELALSHLKKMNIEPSQAVFVGNDILNDMTTARKTGMKCALFAGDSKSVELREDHPDCAGFRPDAVIKSLPHLLEIIG